MAKRSQKSIQEIMDVLHGVEICTGPDGVKYKKVHYPEIYIPIENFDHEAAGTQYEDLEPGVPIVNVTFYAEKQRGREAFLCLKDPRAKKTRGNKRYMCPYCEFSCAPGRRDHVERHMNGEKKRKIACAKRLQEEPDTTKKAKKKPIEIKDNQTD